MTNDDFDDGLVHNHHSWASLPVTPVPPRNTYPRAFVKDLRTPSTVHHDDHTQPG